MSEVKSIIAAPDDRRIFTAGGSEGIHVWEFFGDTAPKAILATELVPDVQGLGGPAQLDNPITGDDLERREVEEEQKLGTDLPLPEQISSPTRPENPTPIIDPHGPPPVYLPSPTLPHPHHSPPPLIEEVVYLKKEKPGVAQKRQLLQLEESKLFFSLTHSEELPHYELFDKAEYTYKPTITREKHKLPFKQYYDDQRSRIITDKLNLIKGNSDRFPQQMIVGYNNNSHKSVVWNPKVGWFAYIFENMVLS
jgi:hypothetical protein